MKNKFFNLKLIIVLNLILSSCINAQSKEEKIESNIEINQNLKVFFKKFEGNISDKRNLKLLISRNIQDGNHQNLITFLVEDDINEKSNFFYGEINENNFFKIKSSEDEDILVLKGEFISDSKIIAEYLDPETQKYFKINLIETKTPFEIFPIHYSKSITPNNEDCDTITNTLLIDTYRIQTKNLEITNKINNYIEKFIINDQNGNLDSYIKDEDLSYASYSHKLDVIEFNNNYLILKNSNSYKVCGAFGTEYTTEYLNIDLNKGRIIKIDDILLINSKDKLINIIKKELKELNEDFMISDNNVQIDNNYALLKNGIMIVFNEYELSDFVFGIQIFLPYSEIYEILNTKSEIYNDILKW